MLRQLAEVLATDHATSLLAKTWRASSVAIRDTSPLYSIINPPQLAQ